MSACPHFPICTLGLQYNSDTNYLELGATSEVKGSGSHKRDLTSNNSYKLRDSQATFTSDRLTIFWVPVTRFHKFLTQSTEFKKEMYYDRCVIANEYNSEPVKRDIQGMVWEDPKCKASCLLPVELEHLTQLTQGSVSRVFSRVSLWRHDWLNHWP